MTAEEKNRAIAILIEKEILYKMEDYEKVLMLNEDIAFRNPAVKLLEAMEAYAALQNKPHPTAEGAEEFLRRHNISGHDFVYATGFENMVGLLDEFATLHAQRIADKMVEDKLRDELVMFGSYFNNLDPKDHILVKDIDEYLKSKEQ